MNKFILALDIDDAIYPANSTYFGRMDDSHKILEMNMNRIKLMLEKYDMEVFITSSWYSILILNDDKTISYEREEAVKREEKKGNSYLKEEWEAFKLIANGINGRVTGLSNGDRYDDIAKLLKDEHIVISMDDMHLEFDKIDAPDIFEKNYCYVLTNGFITNAHGYKIHSFMAKHRVKT